MRARRPRALVALREAGPAPLAVALLMAGLLHVDFLLVGGGDGAAPALEASGALDPLWVELLPPDPPRAETEQPPAPTEPQAPRETDPAGRSPGETATRAPSLGARGRAPGEKIETAPQSPSEPRERMAPTARVGEEGRAGEPLVPGPPGPPSPGAPDEYAPLPAKPAGTGGPVYTMPGVLEGLLVAKPAATAPAVPVADRLAATKALAGTLSKADAKIGLDLPGAGGVAATVADAVRASTVPTDVKATVEVRLDKTGKVTSVRVSKSSGGDAAVWNKVAESAKAKLGSKQLDVKGEPATIVVKIDSAMRFPSGSKTQGLVEPICANDILEQIAELLKVPQGDVAGPGRGAEIVAPSAPSPENVVKAEALKSKFCIPVGVKGAGDASDVGASARKAVSASYSVQRDGVKALPAGPILPIDNRPRWTPPDPTRTRPDVKGPKPWWQKKRGEK